MWIWINETLKEFEAIIGDKRTYNWFVIIIIGLMIRTDTAGVASIVRAFNLSAATYPLLLHFFRSERFSLRHLEWRWQKILANSPLLYRVRGMAVMAGDGVMKSKEGRYMPGVKKLHQDSENSAKGEYIFGHIFGGIGVIIGSKCKKMYCALISLRLHGGLDTINSWNKHEDYKEDSHVVKIIKDASRAVRVFGSSLLLLDRLFLTVPMLKALAEEPLLNVVTKTKINAKAFFHPKPKSGSGAPRKKGDKIKIASLFETMSDSFTTVTALMYGEMKEISYYYVDLLWGAQWYQNLRFVMVWYEGKKSILVSTDLTLLPIEIIELYCHRFKIECAFRELKQVIAGFGYQFWSKYMPKLNRYKSNDFNQERQKVIVDKSERQAVLKTVKATKCFALLSCMALGML